MISTKLNIGANLLKLRMAKNYTQTALAQAIGMKQPGYCDIEGNRTMPTVPTLQKLAEFLEVPLVKLFEEEEEKAIAEIFTICKQLGGTISGEHGIGLVQQEYMHLVFSEKALEVQRNIKKVFDPNGILNPGKMFG